MDSLYATRRQDTDEAPRMWMVVSASVLAIFNTTTGASAQPSQQTPPTAAIEERERFEAGIALGIGSATFHPTGPDAPAVEPYAGVGVALWGAWRFADRLSVSLDANIVDRSGVE